MITTQKVYNEDPLEVAKMFENHGIRRLHVVDLDGARRGRIIALPYVGTAGETYFASSIDFQGGLKQEEETWKLLSKAVRRWLRGRKHRREESGNIHFLNHQVWSGENHPSELMPKIR